ncbi:MAG: thioredoxin family protein [Flavobacteriaceae bacterium]|nr:MAG: thioredoxin family protein [Flavobacteriaceae bacterium]
MEILEDKTTKELLKETLSKGVSYHEYRTSVENLANEGKSTGTNQTEALSNYTLLNHKRMKRWDKTFKTKMDNVLKTDKKMTWIVLTESWCGDAAHSMPIMNKIVEQDPNITLKVVLRDENLELMNRFLTNGTLAIPKLIMVDDETGDVVGDWGPRPRAVLERVENFKELHGKLTSEFKEELQIWYNKDKGGNTFNDLLQLLALE